MLGMQVVDGRKHVVARVPHQLCGAWLINAGGYANKQE